MGDVSVGTGVAWPTGDITKLLNKCPILERNLKGVKAIAKTLELLDLYNARVKSLPEIVRKYRIATDKIDGMNKTIENTNTAQAKFNKFAQSVLNEFAKYKVEKANLKNAIQNIKNELSENEKNIKDKDIKKHVSQLQKKLSTLENQLSKIKDQSKAIKQSFSTKYGILPMYTLNNALYHEKNNGGVIGILIQVHDFIISNEHSKSRVKALKDMLDKKFEYELKKIESVANFREQGNPNLQLAENMEIKTDDAYTALNTLMSQIKQKTNDASQVLKQNISPKKFIKSVNEFTVENEVETFVKGKYYENAPESFAKSMEAFCALAYLNEASKELLPDLLSDITK